MSKEKEEFREVKLGDTLAARVYKDGRVLFGASAKNTLAKHPVRVEIEVETDTKSALQFCEGMLGAIHIIEGRL